MGKMQRPAGVRRRLAILSGVCLVAFCVQLMLVVPAGAGNLTGGFAPVVINGGADVNGSGGVNGRDDSNDFYGDTEIIDGLLDCDAWGVVANRGDAGDGVINGADDCALVGYDGTIDGITIEVANGVFQMPDGRLPKVFNAADPNNPDISASDFAWSAIDGRVDSNGNETIDADGDDCHFGLVGVTLDVGLGSPADGYDVLGNDLGGTNPCGFANPPNTANNGLVDLDDSGTITAADSCATRCVFGHNVVLGKVQELECPGFEGASRNQVVGTPGNDVLRGTAGADIICGLGGNDVLRGRGGNDLVIGGRGADVLGGGRGRDTLGGGRGNDQLFGQRGRDRLFGGFGSDYLNGGSGFDRCRGGPGVDTVVNCEAH